MNDLFSKNGCRHKNLHVDGKKYDLLVKEQKSSKPDVPRLVIVSFLPIDRTAKLLYWCIESIRNFTNSPYELWIVDNNSPRNNIEWLFRYDDVNLVFNRTDPKEQGSYANAIALEIAIKIIPQNTQFIMTLHQDTVACREGWLAYLLSKFDEKTGAVGTLLDKFRVPEGVLHVYGYIIDFQLFQKLGLTFLPDLPALDVGDKAIVDLRKAGYNIFSTPNTFRDAKTLEAISEKSPFRNINVCRSVDDQGDIIFMHLGRGVPRSQGQNVTAERSVEIWESFIRKYLLPNVEVLELSRRNIFTRILNKGKVV